MPLADHSVIAGADLSSVRAALRDAGFDDSARTALEQAAAVGGEFSLTDALAATDDHSPQSTLLRLLTLGAPVTTADAAAALDEHSLRTLLSLGVLTADPAGLRAELAIVSTDGHFTTRDFNPALTGRPLTDDHVLGVGPATQTLAALVPHDPVGSVLDLGTGQGHLALLAAAHAREVLATDISQRALSAAALAAGLNERSNITFRRGSLFEPAGRAAFDLIISNAPFVIAPPGTPRCAAGGSDLAEQIVREGSLRLQPGGTLCALANWTHADDWSTPLSWLPGRGSAWLLRFETWSPRDYAARWIREFNLDPAREAPRWVDHLERRGAGAVSFGAVLYRNNESPPAARRADHSPADFRRGHAGGVVSDVLDNLARLASASAGDLLDLPLAVAPTVEIEQRLRPGADGGLAPASAVIRHLAAVQLALGLEPGVLGLLAALDGQRTAAEAIAAFAESRGMPGERFTAPCLTVIDRLLRSGFLRSKPPGPFSERFV